MIVRFIGQPFEGEGNLYDFLAEVLLDETFDALLVVAAWAKRSGLRRIAPELRRFRDRAGQSSIIVGIDEGGATRQGLQLALELFDDVRVFHDPTRRTFHPKIFVARGLHGARLLLGSNNLTAGGVFFNYEAAIDVHLDLAIEGDAEFLEAVDMYVRRLLSESELCLDLDQELLDRLAASQRLRIQDEDDSRGRQQDEPEDVDEAGIRGETVTEEDFPFGRAQVGKRPDPAPTPLQEATVPVPPQPARELEAEVPQPIAATASGPQTSVVRRWTKQLARSDAQQPSPGSNPTGNLRLTQAGHPIDWRTFFRNDLFGPAPWTPDVDSQGNPVEIARITFEVVIRGTARGTLELTIDHGPHREAGQANHVTVLHWSDLTPLFHQTSYVGDFVVIERLSDGRYRLEIRPDEPPAIL